MNLLQVDSNGDVLLESIAVMAQAHKEGGGDDSNYVYFEKLEPETIYGDVWQTSAGFRFYVSPGTTPIPIGITVVRYNDPVAQKLSCEPLALAKCDQSKVGVFPFPL